MKSLLFGPRRQAAAGPQSVGSVESAFAPALTDGRWHVPARFNFTRDVVEALAQDQKRRALTYLGHDVVIEPRTFAQLAHGAAGWATLLREAGVRPGDRVLVLAGATPDWAEIMLAGIKVGAVLVPSAERLTASALDIRIAASGARVVVASRRAELEVSRCSRTPTVLPVETAAREAQRLPKEAPTHDTAARDPAFIVSTTGRANGPRGVLHTHASAFAARVHAEHWLDAGLGDVVWCTAPPDSSQALWSTLLGPWARGASVVLHDGTFDPAERLDLLQRLGVTVLCQSPAEYRALAETGKLARYRWARPRRLVSTGEELRGRPRPGVRGRVGADDPERIRAGRGRSRRRPVGRRCSSRLDRTPAPGSGRRSGRRGRPRASHRVRGLARAAREPAVALRRVLERTGCDERGLSRGLVRDGRCRRARRGGVPLAHRTYRVSGTARACARPGTDCRGVPCRAPRARSCP